MDKSGIVKIANGIVIVAAIVIATVISLTRGSTTIDFSYADSTLTVTGPEKFYYAVPFDQIATFKYLESFDKGDSVTGKTTRKITYGKYLREDIGEYSLITSDKISTYVFVTSRDARTLVFNYQDAAFTKNIYDSLKNTLEKYSYDVIYE